MNEIRGMRAKTNKGTYLVVYTDDNQIITAGCYADEEGVIQKSFKSPQAAQSAWENAQKNWQTFEPESLPKDYHEKMMVNIKTTQERLVTDNQPGFCIFAELL